MKKNYWNEFLLYFVEFYIYYIIINFLCKKYLPNSYNENGNPKLVTYLIMFVGVSLLALLTDRFIIYKLK